MNPIENLWDEINRQLKDTKTSNKNELRRKIKETWENIPASWTKKLVDWMPCRLEAVIDAKGGGTKYWVCMAIPIHICVLRFMMLFDLYQWDCTINFVSLKWYIFCWYRWANEKNFDIFLKSMLIQFMQYITLILHVFWFFKLTFWTEKSENVVFVHVYDQYCEQLYVSLEILDKPLENE